MTVPRWVHELGVPPTPDPDPVTGGSRSWSGVVMALCFLACALLIVVALLYGRTEA